MTIWFVWNTCLQGYSILFVIFVNNIITTDWLISNWGIFFTIFISGCLFQCLLFYIKIFPKSAKRVSTLTYLMRTWWKNERQLRFVCCKYAYIWSYILRIRSGKIFHAEILIIAHFIITVLPLISATGAYPFSKL